MLNLAYKLFFLFSFISMKVFVRKRDYYDSQRHFAFITKGSYSYIVQSWIFFREVNTPLNLTLKHQRTLQQSDCKNNFSASCNRSRVMNLKLCKLRQLTRLHMYLTTHKHVMIYRSKDVKVPKSEAFFFILSYYHKITDPLD